ncbi:isopentenyl-diphosphate delta-isomerase idi1 [Homalodisca vitripennis]|nr:isopentenyl-diphosphate delta-isomerase idi1 [Homalodisca vitripennis]
MLSSVRVSVRRAMATNVAKKIDQVQGAALEESCILVDNSDKVIGRASKHDCHKVGPDGNIPLHRAFSVFIFNSKNEILLQKRSDMKVTFPGYITNACCSHPLFDGEGETEEKNALGIRLAAQRRLQHELGIPKHEIDIDALQYLTRIHYKSVGDGVWGEHEIDYILFLRKDVTLNPNPNEVSRVCFVPKNEFNTFLNKLEEPITPWFRLIVENRLSKWWDNINDLKRFYDHGNINTFGSTNFNL